MINRFHTRLPGFSLWEVVVVLAILALTMTWAVPAADSYIIKQRLWVRKMDVTQALLSVRQLVLSEQRGFVLRPLHHQDWDSGLAIVPGKDCDASSSPYQVLPWHDHVVHMMWRGFTGDTCLRFTPWLLSNRCNGRFRFYARGSYRFTMMVNRLGRAYSEA